MAVSAATAAAALVVLALAAAASPALATPPHIISILQDDLGWYDSGVHNPAAEAWSGNITSLAKQGIVLTNHYAHWHCSPSRRSFLTSRLPVHHGEQLSPDADDDIDLRYSWVSDKLSEAGYKAHAFGKWHTGFRSQNHLWAKHGFQSTVGSFQTGGAYSGPKHSMRWQDEHPIWNDAQFSDPPSGCGNVARTDGRQQASDRTEGDMCDGSSFEANTQLPCGSALEFVNATSAAECCRQCANVSTCTHWVYAPVQADKPACHIKTGGVPSGCAEHKQGSTSGLSSNTPPSPSSAECVNEYSTDLWGSAAVQALQNHDPATDGPLYLHLCFQAVHVPYDPVPGNPTNNTYHGMLWRADLYVGQLVELLKAKGMWDNTLILYSSDNGGTTDGINFPLRGEKHSNWEGGMRVASFVSGGYVPMAMRGTNNSINMHLVDWYPTFCALSGHSDCTDDPPVAPLPPDPAHPYANRFGEDSFPPIDGVNVWPMLMSPSSYPIDAAHKNLVLSKEVLVAGKWKLLVSQPHFKSQEPGWKQPDGKWQAPAGAEEMDCMKQDVAPTVSALPAPYASGASVCLFDLRADPGEHSNVASQNPDVVKQLWTTLNITVAGQRDCQGWTYKGVPGAAIPGPAQPDGTTSCSPPDKLGPCNATCANTYWASHWGNPEGTICGVPGCTA